jgi:pimeloyl-ACP methyl ester carboxylesterase
MERHIILIDNVHIHYRKKGTGPFLFLLHPSPRSSKIYESFMNILSDNFCVIAPDLPGYGFSDPMLNPINDIYDYVSIMINFFRSFTHKPINLYGSATGAQLAIAIGLTEPLQIKNLYLDNAADFSDLQRNYILSEYFPDLTPKEDGGHLIKTWYHIRDSFLFFPWFDYKNGKRLTSGLPPASVLQETLVDYLLAGKNWDSAYKAAFSHEKAEKVLGLRCRTTLFRWKGSIMLEYIDQLLMNNFDQNIQIEEIPAPIAYRYKAMKDIFFKTQNDAQDLS